MAASEGLPLLQDHTLSPRSAAAAKQAETRHRRQRRIAIVVALLAVVAVVAIASKSSRVQSLLPWQLEQDEGYAAVMADYRKTHLDFDGVVQVTENDQVVFTDVSGHAIEESAAPMDIDSVFGIGSNSKLFTAVALYQLQERGRVNLSTPVNEVLDQTDFAAFGFPNQSVWCPRVAGAAADSPCENITFVQLMHMGSGIGDSLNCDNVDAAHCYRTADNLLYYKGSLAPYVGMVINDPLVFKPDTNYSYSNPNYYLLSYLVEKIAGQPLEQYLAENIVKPIGLKDTFYDPYSGFKGLSTSKVVQEYVHYYVRSNTSVERIGTGTCSPFLNNGAISGSGGFQSSVPDMHRWFADLFGSRGTKSKVLTADSIRMLIDRVNPVNPSYGQGIGVGARGQDGWPQTLTYCGGIKCTTTCNAMVFLDGRPDEHGLISVYSNHQHGTFVNRTVFDQWRPHEALPTDQPEGAEQDAGGAGVLPTPLARVYRAKHTTTPSN